MYGKDIDNFYSSFEEELGIGEEVDPTVDSGYDELFSYESDNLDFGVGIETTLGMNDVFDIALTGLIAHQLLTNGSDRIGGGVVMPYAYPTEDGFAAGVVGGGFLGLGRVLQWFGRDCECTTYYKRMERGK